MALIVSDNIASAAGVFTTNQVYAAPVKLCKEHLVNIFFFILKTPYNFIII